MFSTEFLTIDWNSIITFMKKFLINKYQLKPILGNNIDLEAQLFSDDGKEVYNVIKSGKSTDPQSLGKIAGEEILKKAGKNFIKKR